MFLSGDSQEDTNGPSSYHYSFVFFSGGSNSSFRYSSYFLSSFLMLSHADAPLNHSLLPIHLFWSAQDMSQDLCFHSQSVQDISRLLSHSSHLIQPVQSSLLNHFNGVSFEWALTHRSFPRILPDSSNFPGATPKVFQSLT